MKTTTIDFPTLNDLAKLLTETRDQALKGDHRPVGQAMIEALKLCESARTAQGAVHMQLQGALGSIRAGRPDEAAELIERAIGIGERWVGAPQCKRG